MATNPLQWPEIRQHTQRLVHFVRAFDTNAELAARVLQRRIVRRQEVMGCADSLRSGPSLKDAYELFVAENAVAHVKLDGTNFAVGSNGQLAGRRQLLEANKASYQNCDISSLKTRGSQVNALKDVIAQDANCQQLLAEPHVTGFNLYGELVDKVRHEYEAKAGLAKSWRIFGVAIGTRTDEETDEDMQSCVEAQALTEALLSAGYAAGYRDNGVVVLALNDRLRFAMDKVGIKREEVAEELCRGSLVQIVDLAFEWMHDVRGEGVVISHREPGHGWVLGKWKCACEPQSTNKGLLDAIVQDYDSQNSFALSLLPPGVEDMFRKMNQCLSATYTPFIKEAEKGKGSDGMKKKATTATECEGASLVSDAIQSALTKFDSLEAYFAKGPGGRDEIKALLIKEVTEDVPADAKKLVSGLVSKHVGMAFGKWSKQRGQK